MIKYNRRKSCQNDLDFLKEKKYEGDHVDYKGD